MEIIIEKTNLGRVLLRYEDGNMKRKWIDIEALLSIAGSEIDFVTISNYLLEAMTELADYFAGCNDCRIYYDTMLQIIGNLGRGCIQLKSLDAEDTISFGGYIGETKELFRYKIKD